MSVIWFAAGPSGRKSEGGGLRLVLSSSPEGTEKSASAHHSVDSPVVRSGGEGGVGDTGGGTGSGGGVEDLGVRMAEAQRRLMQSVKERQARAREKEALARASAAKQTLEHASGAVAKSSPSGKKTSRKKTRMRRRSLDDQKTEKWGEIERELQLALDLSPSPRGPPPVPASMVPASATEAPLADEEGVPPASATDDVRALAPFRSLIAHNPSKWWKCSACSGRWQKNE
jgi:hypothetical protein